MTIITHRKLFDHTEIEKLGDLERLKLLIVRNFTPFPTLD